MGPITGMTNTFTQGMYFQYGGENAYMDHLTATGGAYTIFRDDYPYYCAVAFDQGSYRTVGTDFELGLLTDASPPSTRTALLDSIMKFFGVMNPGVVEYKDTPIADGISMSIFPNPCNRTCSIKLQGLNAKGERSLVIYDVSGRFLIELPIAENSMPSVILWHGVGESGREVPEGIYFVQLRTNSSIKTEKIIL